MRRIAALALFAGLLSAGSLPPDLANINRIYVLPMSGGLDQYLANRLTRGSRFVVSTDPKVVDAILTDNVGQAFDLRYKDLYPPPEPPAPKEDKASKDSKDSKEAKDKKKDEGPGYISTPEAVRNSSFSRGKGNVFLVDRNSRQVLWSYYLKPKNSSAQELDHVADRIISQLMKDLNAKPKQ